MKRQRHTCSMNFQVSDTLLLTKSLILDFSTVTVGVFLNAAMHKFNN